MKKIWIVLIMIITVIVIIIAPALVGAVVGALTSFALGAEILPIALIGWSAGRCLLWARILDERERERRERSRAVKPAEKTARLEGYKASVAPFCGLFSLHKKIAQNGRLSPEAASGTAGRT